MQRGSLRVFSFVECLRSQWYGNFGAGSGVDYHMQITWGGTWRVNHQMSLFEVTRNGWNLKRTFQYPKESTYHFVDTNFSFFTQYIVIIFLDAHSRKQWALKGKVSTEGWGGCADDLFRVAKDKKWKSSLNFVLQPGQLFSSKYFITSWCDFLYYILVSLYFFDQS